MIRTVLKTISLYYMHCMNALFKCIVIVNKMIYGQLDLLFIWKWRACAANYIKKLILILILKIIIKILDNINIYK